MGDKISLNDKRKYVLIFSAIFALIVLLSAWNCDDAYHGFVTVRNLVNGKGFVYNIGERVNVCTCPLFILILTVLTLIVREASIAAFILRTIFSTAAFYIVADRFCEKVWQIALVFFAMISSYCFLSFTTSGLENCLLFLELACFISVYSKYEEFDFKKLLLISFIDAMVLFTRTDVGFMLFFPTAYVFLFRRKCSVLEMFGAGIIGLIPYFLWEIFSAFYFGSWFPNPFYVKVGTSIPINEYIAHGIQYMLITLIYDAVLIIPIFVAIIALILNKNVKVKIFGIGILTKVLWVFYMGGDFMVGRHFTDSFFVSIAWIIIIINKDTANAIEIEIRDKQFKFISYATLLICLIMSITNRTSIARTLVYPQLQDQCGEERDYYYPTLGLVPRLIANMYMGIDSTDYTWQMRDEVKEAKEAAKRGDKGIINSWAPGVEVYKLNEKIFWVDDLALGDAFLAKFPSVYTRPWRVGHTNRAVPDGYSDSIKYGENRLEDPDLREYYDMYLKVTRGDLFSPERIKLAFEFAMGKYQYLIDRYVNKNKQ